MKTDFQQFAIFARDTLIGFAVFSIPAILVAVGIVVD
jgi:hypothetical protein